MIGLKKNKKKVAWIAYLTAVHGFALVGLLFVGVFFAIRLKLTDEPGYEDPLSSQFQQQADAQLAASSQIITADSKFQGEVASIDAQIAQLKQTKDLKVNYLCNLNELSYAAPKNVKKIIYAVDTLGNEQIALPMIFAIKTHLVNQGEIENNVQNCVANFDLTKLDEKIISDRISTQDSENIFSWADKKEWLDAAASITKEKPLIDKAAAAAEIEPRLIVSSLMVEQLRLFYSQRELYKKFFEPLKILANSNKISLGVMAIKEETAQAIEQHLKDPNSGYYLGPDFEHILDYPAGADISAERYKRLTDDRNHYYNYLYGALYLKQFLVQWQKAGFPIDSRPEVLATLFNVGFPQSKPKANPVVGGSTVVIDNTTYSFGRLAYEFYYSGELLDQFPYQNLK